MKRNIELNQENQQNKKQKIKLENELETQQNSLLEVFDTNIISQIFIELTNPINSEKEEEKEDYKFCFSNCISFSLTSKIFNLISKQTQFSVTIFKQEKIENINFNIYLKLNYILQKERRKILNTKQQLLNSLLLYTSKNGIYDIIPTLILNGANVNYDSFGENPLWYSCSGYYKTSKILIENNSDINFKDGMNDSILHKACRSGNLKLIKYLINLGLNINEKNMINQTPLFEAFRNGNIEVIEYLVDEKKCDFDPAHHRYFLFGAFISGDLELVKYLIDEKKININNEHNQDQNLTHQNIIHLNTLIISCELGNPKEVPHFIEPNENILFIPFRTGNLELVKYLIEEKKCDFNSYSNNEEHILFAASNSGNLELVKYLIEEKKLEISIKNRCNRTILFYGMYSKNIELIDYLLSLGLDIDHKDQFDRTVLYSCSIDNTDLEVMNHLIARGADLTIKYGDKKKKNILQIARSEFPKNRLLIKELQTYF